MSHPSTARTALISFVAPKGGTQTEEEREERDWEGRGGQRVAKAASIDTPDHAYEGTLSASLAGKVRWAAPWLETRGAKGDTYGVQP